MLIESFFYYLNSWWHWCQPWQQWLPFTLTISNHLENSYGWTQPLTNLEKSKQLLILSNNQLVTSRDYVISCVLPIHIALCGQKRISLDNSHMHLIENLQCVIGAIGHCCHSPFCFKIHHQILCLKSLIKHDWTLNIVYKLAHQSTAGMHFTLHIH